MSAFALLRRSSLVHCTSTAWLAIALSASGAAASPEDGAAIAAAPDAPTLQALIDKNPQLAAEAGERAKALGVALVTLDAGPEGQSNDLKLVAGGRKTFRDCRATEACPAMVVVPASGSGFKTGSPEDEEGHQPDETLRGAAVPAFAIGVNEVSVGEYKACVAAGGCREPEWLEPGGQHNIETGSSTYYRSLGASVTGDGQPVVGVSHGDAVRYAAWLAKISGKPYRLPSEAEWEHAARAGTTTAYWWGARIDEGGKVHAACLRCGSEWDGKGLAPAAAFDANPWGLHNALGNVWEWVADTYCEDRSRGPSDATPWTEAACPAEPTKTLQVLRGGSAFYDAKLSRAAMRVRNVADFRNFSVGFRVARGLLR